jgi:DNA-binding MarR family transcriptional regulator
MASRYWRQGSETPPIDFEACKAGDRLAPVGKAHKWRTLRLGLAARGLALASVGKALFVLPADVLHRLPLLRELAADPTAKGILRDLVEEAFDAHGAEAKSLAGFLAGAGASADGEHRDLPGGDLEAFAKRERQEKQKLVEAQMNSARRAYAKVSRLSKLQRALLRFAREFSGSPDRPAYGSWVPMSKLPPHLRTSPQALSRSVRHLEARGLLEVRRESGRVREVRLSYEGARLRETVNRYRDIQRAKRLTPVAAKSAP